MSNLYYQLKDITLEEIPGANMKDQEIITPLQLFVDGSANPNPGAIKLGLVLKYESEIIWRNHFQAGTGTNNEAEFIAIIKGLELLKKIYSTVPDLSSKACTIISDSRLATTAIIKVKPPKNTRLFNLYAQCINNMDLNPKPVVTWRSRQDNIEADYLSRNIVP